MPVNSTYIVVVPEVEVPTKWAYSSYDENLKHQTSNIQTNPNKQQTISKNDLEAVVIEKYPVIQKVKERLLSLGCAFAQMSGSGPSVFGWPADERLEAEIKKEYPQSCLVRPVARGVEEYKLDKPG